MSRWVQPSLILIAAVLFIIAASVRSNGPFVNKHFATELSDATPMDAMVRWTALPRTAVQIVSSIDAISSGAKHATIAGHPSSTFHFGFGQPLAVDGWAIDRMAVKPALGIVARLDERPIKIARIKSQRPDVAAAFANQAYVESGFHIEIPATQVPFGSHRLTFLIVAADRSSTSVVDPHLVVVSDRNGPS